VELTAPGADSGSLLEELLRRGEKPGTRCLYPRSNLAGDFLPDQLRAAGWQVDAPIAYYTRLMSAEKLEAFLREQNPEAVLFCSPSAVQALGENGARLMRPVVIGSLGPRTSEALRSAGLTVHFEAEPRSFEGFARSLARHFGPGLPRREEGPIVR
jgi:uroporphyrinogen-III synthase